MRGLETWVGFNDDDVVVVIFDWVGAKGYAVPLFLAWCNGLLTHLGERVGFQVRTRRSLRMPLWRCWMHYRPVNTHPHALRRYMLDVRNFERNSSLTSNALPCSERVYGLCRLELGRLCLHLARSRRNRVFFIFSAILSDVVFMAINTRLWSKIFLKYVFETA